MVYAKGSKPRGNCGWAQEAALDIEWAHAMAPNAKIVLVEAASNSFTDLFQAVDVASAVANAQEVSMSWGGGEFSSEAGNDGHFTHPGIVYLAASGDTGGATIYPGVSPNVVAAGGTRINRNGAGAFVSETAWSGSGGGPSKYEPRPAYQDIVQTIVGGARGVPDYSFDADPNSGVSVYDSTSCKGASGWMVFGGTSVASPSLSGIINSAGSNTSSAAEALAPLSGRRQQRVDDQQHELPRHPERDGRQLQRQDRLGFRHRHRQHPHPERQVTDLSDLKEPSFLGSFTLIALTYLAKNAFL